MRVIFTGVIASSPCGQLPHYLRFPFLLAILAGLLSGCETGQHRSSAAADRFFGNDHEPCALDNNGRLPIHERNGHIYVDATINGQPVALIFDTGAQKTILSRATVDRLKLSPEPHRSGEILGIGGKTKVNVYRVKFNLAGSGEWERYVLGGAFGINPDHPFADGLLSRDFFGGFDLDLDLPGNRINIYFPEHDCSLPSAYMQGPLFQVPFAHPELRAVKMPPSKLRIAAFLAGLIQASPRVIVTIGGKELIAGIDSGSPDNVLFLNGAEKIGVTPKQVAGAEATIALGTGPNPVAAVRYTIDAVDLGPLEIRQLPVKLVDQPGLPGFDMLLGLDFIKRVHIWISGSSDTLIMQYPPSPSP